LALYRSSGFYKEKRKVNEHRQNTSSQSFFFLSQYFRVLHGLGYGTHIVIVVNIYKRQKSGKELPQFF
jgi:hypothetical protein